MDRRTKRQKLEAMANQSVSPHEAAVARQKLADLPPEPPPSTTEYWRLNPADRTETITVHIETVYLDPRFEDAMDAIFDEIVQNVLRKARKRNG